MSLFPVVADDATREYLDGARRHELLIVQNRTSGQYYEPRRGITSPDEQWVRAAGTGTLISWSINHVKEPDGTVTEHPFGIVELTEGPWLWTELATPNGATPVSGSHVTVDFVSSGPDESHVPLPIFTVEDPQL